MRPSLFLLPAFLSSISATVASNSDRPPKSIKLRSIPGSPRSHITGAAQTDNHFQLQGSKSDTLPEDLALRSILGLDPDHMGSRQVGEEEPVATVQLTGQSYIVDVTIDDQVMPVLIDTGSADLWVAPDSFVCLDENHNETSKEACNIPVYFEGTFSEGAVGDQYFSISCA
jgi:hypothetical protein